MSQHGRSITLVVYDEDQDILDREFTFVTGFSLHDKEECTVRVPFHFGIFCGSIFTFKVDRKDAEVFYPLPNSIKIQEDNGGIVTVDNQTTKMSTNIIFSSQMPNNDKCAWSSEFGKVFIPEQFHVVRDSVYKANVVRDRSPEVAELGVYFSICDVPKKVEKTEKAKQCMEQMEEELMRIEEEMRLAEEASRPQREFGQIGFGTSSSSNYNSNSNGNNYRRQDRRRGEGEYNKRGPGRRNNFPGAARGHGNGHNPYYPSRGGDTEEDERMKKLANKEVIFLIACIYSKPGMGARGEAWGVNCRSISLHHLNLDGMETTVKPGDWVTGVVKYSRKLKHVNSGFSVEKMYHIEDTKPLCTSVAQDGVVQMGLELFFDHMRTEIIEPKSGFPYFAVRHEQVHFVLVHERDFYQHQGKKVHGILRYQNVDPETLSSWLFVEYVRDLKDQDRIAPPIERVVESSDEEGSTEELGPPPDFDEDSEDEGRAREKVPIRLHRPQFTNQPTGSNLTRPTPVRAQQQNDDPGASMPSSSRFSAPSKPLNNSYGPSKAEPSTYEQPSKFDDGASPEYNGLITESSEQDDCAILFFTATDEGGQACLLPRLRDSRLRNGDWLKFRARKLPVKQFGCSWEAIPQSAEKTDAVNPTKVTKNGHVQMETLLDFQYFQESPLAIWSIDVGYVFSTKQVQKENSYGPQADILGMIEEAREYLESGNELPKIRAWIQYIYDDDTGDYSWQLAVIRGPEEEIAEYDRNVQENNLGGVSDEDEDEIAMEKQKAKARMEMELAQSSRSMMSNGRARAAGSMSSTSRSSRYSNTQTRESELEDISESASVVGGAAASIVSTSTINDADLLELWSIDKVRSAVKEKNFDLYERLDTQAEDVRSRSSSVRGSMRGSPMYMGRGGPGTSQLSSNGIGDRYPTSGRSSGMTSSGGFGSAPTSAFNVPPTSSSYKNQAPPTYGNQAPPTFGNQAPPTFGNQAPPTFGNQAPPTFGNQAPPTSSYKNQAPPTFGNQAPPTSSFRDEATSNFGNQAPPTLSFRDQATPTFSSSGSQMQAPPTFGGEARTGSGFRTDNSSTAAPGFFRREGAPATFRPDERRTGSRSGFVTGGGRGPGLGFGRGPAMTGFGQPRGTAGFGSFNREVSRTNASSPYDRSNDSGSRASDRDAPPPLRSGFR